MLTERFADVPSVQIVRGDATSLGDADDSFSGAACFTMLHHVPTSELQDRLFAEIARVLRPGAPLVASDSLASDELKAHHEGDCGEDQRFRLGRRRADSALTQQRGQNEVSVAPLDGFDDRVPVGGPHGLVEDLNLDVAAVACAAHERAD